MAMSDEEIKALRAEARALIQKEKAMVEEMKSKGQTVVRAWVHPPTGDDYAIEIAYDGDFTAEELRPSVEDALRKAGSKKLTDWAIL